jgi:hypothetical protein
MPSIKQIFGAVAMLTIGANALPAQPRLSTRALKAYDISARQLASTGLPPDLTDIDILQLYVSLPCKTTLCQWPSKSHKDLLHHILLSFFLSFFHQAQRQSP